MHVKDRGVASSSPSNAAAGMLSRNIPVLERQAEVERRSLLRPALSPGAAMVAANDPVDDRQPDASAGEFGLRMHALKRTEELARILHVEASAVVTHEIHVLGGLCESSDLDEGRIAVGGELEGVGQQVGQNLLEQGAVGAAVR